MLPIMVTPLKGHEKCKITYIWIEDVIIYVRACKVEQILLSKGRKIDQHVSSYSVIATCKKEKQR